MKNKQNRMQRIFQMTLGLSVFMVLAIFLVSQGPHSNRDAVSGDALRNTGKNSTITLPKSKIPGENNDGGQTQDNKNNAQETAIDSNKNTNSQNEAEVSGPKYFLSPTGNDKTGDGSKENPWFTLKKAWTVAKPGDTIYLRGGIYRYHDSQILTGKSGTQNEYINVWAYPNEYPRLTKSDDYAAPNWPNALIRLTSEYTYWKNIEIFDYKQESSGIWYGMAVYQGGNNKFEGINSHDNGHGMAIRSSSGNLVLNSDFHHNSDPLTQGDAYGNADGLEIGYIDDANSAPNVVRGCRFYWNSDDGLDLWDNEGQVIVENSFAWYNGFIPGTFNSGGDGNGFKLGKTDTSGSGIQRTITDSVAAYNKKWGFVDNGAKGDMVLIGNIAYKNGYKNSAWTGGFYFSSGGEYKLRSNIAYENSGEDAVISGNDALENSWNLGYEAMSGSFGGISISDMENARNPDGTLQYIQPGAIAGK